jgi:hypothetical protein
MRASSTSSQPPTAVGTVRTLTSSINHLFQEGLSPQQVTMLVDALKSRGIITVTGTKLSYELLELEVTSPS